MKIVRKCDDCGREDSIDHVPWLCPSCEDKPIEPVSDKKESDKEEIKVDTEFKDKITKHLIGGDIDEKVSLKEIDKPTEESPLNITKFL